VSAKAKKKNKGWFDIVLDLVRIPLYYHTSEHLPTDRFAYGITSLGGQNVVLIRPENLKILKAKLPFDYVLVEWDPRDPKERAAFLSLVDRMKDGSN